MFIIFAIEDLILTYVFFAMINCSIGAYKHYKKTEARTDYEFTSYFAWFFIWWIMLPREISRALKSLKS